MFTTETDFNDNYVIFLFPCKGTVYHEGCDCPQTSGSVWEAHMHCPQSFPQIDRDLSLFTSVDLDINAREIPQRFGQRQSLCHYAVKDNKVQTRHPPTLQLMAWQLPFITTIPLKNADMIRDTSSLHIPALSLQHSIFNMKPARRVQSGLTLFICVSFSSGLC